MERLYIRTRCIMCTRRYLMHTNLPAPEAMGNTDIDQYEANTHPFVVKVWLEETAAEAGQATWRGYITHVPSGERRYLEDRASNAHLVERLGLESNPNLWYHIEHKPKQPIIAALFVATVSQGGWMKDTTADIRPGSILVGGRLLC